MSLRTLRASSASHHGGVVTKEPSWRSDRRRGRNRVVAALAAGALVIAVVPAAQGQGQAGAHGASASVVSAMTAGRGAPGPAPARDRKGPRTKRPPVVTGTAITALPFYGYGDYVGDGSGGDGTARANALVSAACNDGEALRAPQWYTLQGARLGQVVVHADAIAYPRGVENLSHGTAIVDLQTGRVLACDAGPATLPKDRPVGVVGYFSGVDQDCENDEEYVYCRGVQLRVFVDLASQPPSNDTWTAARTISSVPFAASVDLSLAGADDLPLRHYEDCLLSSLVPVNTATAWWRVTMAETVRPTLTVDATRNWVDAGQWRVPYGEILAETEDRPALLPLTDPWDCESDGVPQAGQTTTSPPSSSTTPTASTCSPRAGPCTCASAT